MHRKQQRDITLFIVDVFVAIKKQEYEKLQESLHLDKQRSDIE